METDTQVCLFALPARELCKEQRTKIKINMILPWKMYWVSLTLLN